MNYSEMYDLTIPVAGFNKEIISEFMMNLLAKHAPKFAEFLDGRDATAEELQAYADFSGLSLEQLLENTSMDADQLLAMFGEYQSDNAPVAEEVAVEAPAAEEVVAEATSAEEVAVEAPAVEEVVAEATSAEEVVTETAPELHAEVETVIDVSAAA
ncbi:MAG: hypothetical protein LW826_01575 [Candidatus Jidaibacter sp.]|jgi:hypothetical protein|nr:hypothetical protein [Candidatus Jidaibacter sp.]